MVSTPGPHNSTDSFFARTRTTRVFKRTDLAQLLYAFLIILLGLGLLASGRLNRLEYGLLDLFFQHRSPVSTHADLVLIEIGEESLQAIGKWPWPAEYHAEMIRILTEWGAQTLVFEDILPEEISPDDQRSLASALRDSGRVFLPVRLEKRPARKIWVHSLPVDLEPGGEKKEWSKPDPEIVLSLKGLGYLQEFPDADGVLRRVPAAMAWASERYFYLGIEAAAGHLGSDADEVLPPNTQDLLINWTGPQTSYKRYAYADIIRSYQALQRGLRPTVDPAEFKGRLCLIGLTSGEQVRRAVTPPDARMTRLEILAQVTHTVAGKHFLRPLSVRQNALLYLFLGLAAAICFLNFHNIRSVLTAAGFLAGWLVLWYVLLQTAGLWVFAVQPMILVLVLFVFSALYAYLAATREQSRLFDLATRDGLTGLYVIRYFREVLNQVVEESLADKTPLSLILTDIDNFKKINDTYGHPAGDFILKKTAQIAQSVIRFKRPAKEMDLIARYGGEEFIVMLRGAPLDEAASKAAERIRVAVEKARFEWEGALIPVTISVGVSALRADEKVPDFMVRRADEALYQAKRTGKNKVCQLA